MTVLQEDVIISILQMEQARGSSYFSGLPRLEPGFPGPCSGLFPKILFSFAAFSQLLCFLFPGLEPVPAPVPGWTPEACLSGAAPPAAAPAPQSPLPAALHAAGVWASGLMTHFGAP